MAVSTGTPASTEGVTVTLRGNVFVLSSHSPKPKQEPVAPTACTDDIDITRSGDPSTPVTIRCNETGQQKTSIDDSVSFRFVTPGSKTYKVVQPTDGSVTVSVNNEGNPNPCTGGGGEDLMFQGIKVSNVYGFDLVFDDCTTLQTLEFDTVLFGDEDFFDIDDPTFITIPEGKAGQYIVTFQGHFAQNSNSTARGLVTLFNQDNVVMGRADALFNLPAGGNTLETGLINFTTLIDAAEGDQFSIVVQACSDDPSGNNLRFQVGYDDSPLLSFATWVPGA